jgi:integrase
MSATGQALPSMQGVYCPMEAEHMARREFQNPSILERETPRGTEYYIRYRVKTLRGIENGKPIIERVERYHALGLKSEVTEAAAKREKSRIMAEVNGQVYTIQSQIPFADLVTLFKTVYMVPENLATPTRKQYASWIDTHILPAFKDKRLCDIKPLDVQVWFAGLKVAPLTRKSIRGLLKSIFARAAEWGYLTGSDPTDVLRAGKGKKSAKRIRPKRIPTPAEVRQILDDVRPDVRLIIETLVWTGLRISECLGLRNTPDHVDVEAGLIHVIERQCRGDVDDPKSDNGVRDVPLGNLAERYRELLASVPAGAYLFRDRKGRPYRDDALLANYLTYRLKKLGLKWPGFGWHAFRRLLATWMAENGATPWEIMTQLGHADVRTSQLYVVGGRGVEKRAERVRAMQEDFAEQVRASGGK